MTQIAQEQDEVGLNHIADVFSTQHHTIETHLKGAPTELELLSKMVATRVNVLEKGGAVKRIFESDPSFWTDDTVGQAEVRQRMGWLDSPKKGMSILPELSRLRDAIQYAGYTHALLLGMGGSSLAPEVLALTFGVREDGGGLGLDLAILDSTDPIQVRQAARRAPVEKTLYIVSSKSGTTSEVNAYFDYFWARAKRRLGKKAGEHFIAITDPGTALERKAIERGIRQVFTADPSVGGRFSALTAFGLVPAALIGLDMERFLQQAQKMCEQCQPDIPVGRNPGLILGAILGEAALHGRDKLTVLADPELSAFGSWVEQLIAESTGKEGKGIIPIDLEPIGSASIYAKDRIFIYLRTSGTLKHLSDKLKKSGHPVLEFVLTDEYQLAAEFFRWEFATAVACGVLGVNAFDQPDVQDSKTRTQKNISIFRQEHMFNEGNLLWQGEGVRVYGQPFSGIEEIHSLTQIIQSFLDQVTAGDYIAINAYLPRNARTFSQLQQLRKVIQKRTSKATTLGFGPRFLHSTGQLHKGGANNGVFIQITADSKNDLVIPGWGITFGQLERAQALGDLEALLARDRRTIRIHLSTAKLVKILK